MKGPQVTAVAGFMVSVGMPYPHFIEPAGCKSAIRPAHLGDSALRETAFPVFPFAAAGNEDDTAQMPKPGPPVAGEAERRQPLVMATAFDRGAGPDLTPGGACGPGPRRRAASAGSRQAEPGCPRVASSDPCRPRPAASTLQRAGCP